jgi:NAD(P)-dependent dehydrogenase (short-subunit alcohol dehydrogenase family)
LTPSQKTPSRRRGQPAQHVAKRAAQPEEIAPAFVLMAAPSCSSYITGEILPIAGGYPA